MKKINDYFSDWANEVASVSEHYHQKGLFYDLPSVAVLPYDRMGVDKYCARIIPVIHSSERKVLQFAGAIEDWTRNAVLYGNSTVIISNDGSYRVSNPERSLAIQDAYGKIQYVEFDAEKNVTAMTVTNGEFEEVLFKIDGEFVPTGARAFTIFHHADHKSPWGQSRITPAQRSLTARLAENEGWLREAGKFLVNPQKVINGVWEGFGEEMGDDVGRLLSGASQILAIPVNPDSNDKVDVTQWEGSSLSSYSAERENYAKLKAAAYEFAPVEFGVQTANPSSADALYAEKEDLILSVQSFEQKILFTVKDAIELVAFYYNTDVEFIWAEPATPSRAAQADAFAKMAAIVPELRFSKKALLWGGIPTEVVEELYPSGEKQRLAELATTEVIDDDFS